MHNDLVSKGEAVLVEQLENGAPNEIVDHLAGSRALDTDVRSPMQTVGNLLGQLSDVECKVIDQYFGLSGVEPLSAEAIAELTGLSAQRVMEIIDGALRQLRQFETAAARQRKVA